MTISITDAIGSAAQLLETAGVQEARREAGSLLARVLNRDRTFVIAHAEDELSDEQLAQFRAAVGRRARREPLQYITGLEEFFKLEFEVTPDVLIPRPETEMVVETALELLGVETRPLIADIGAGSGCIVISLLAELPNAHALATDVSAPALRVAQRNAVRHRVIDRLEFVVSDCFSSLAPAAQFSLIASNPPYVSENELEMLQPEVRYEPSPALFANQNGLAIIQRLLSEAPPFLKADGHLIFEIGFGQSEAVKNLIDLDVWKLIEIRADLQGIPRTVVLQKQRRK
jgi:release factor glutamine methyltransferase